ncbi:hypothetical protein GCM10023193_58290 [Planotetraspora kaengkrachanensis]|uniref:Uncharacterized protein n=1 Tax=Planotetraspora kaengkrachanensis TaxID=575193 RepID=A0A8J3PV53_9ACTN|nr:hypothetical protein Pka01_47510 [Planotetraspora kaengkrachanensis]
MAVACRNEQEDACRIAQLRRGRDGAEGVAADAKRGGHRSEQRLVEVDVGRRYGAGGGQERDQPPVRSAAVTAEIEGCGGVGSDHMSRR